MRVTFVYPDILNSSISSNWVGHFYSGIGWLSSTLKQAGHSVSLLHIIHPIKREQYQAELAATKPDLVAFSSTSLMFGYAQTFAKWTKEWRDVLTICGGIHATISPDEVIADPNFDMTCVGEGENALLELCECLEDNKDCSLVRNLWVRQGRRIVKNELRPLIENLDSLPFPDRTIFQKHSIHDRRGIARIMASRGCPFHCTYCCNHVKFRIYGQPNNYVRFRSVENVIAEIREVLQNDSPIQSFWFDDDILPMRKEWFREFTRRYKEEVRLPYECQARVEFIDKEVVELLAESGCFRVDMGIESGNQQIRQTVMNRHMSNEQIVQAFELCHSHGIRTNSLNMIGLPGEDMAMVLDTVKINAQVKPERASVYIFYPFKGSDLYQTCVEHDLLTEREITSFLEDTKLESDLVARSQLRLIKHNFTELVNIYNFFLERKYLSWGVKLLDCLLKSKAFCCLAFTAKAIHNTIHHPKMTDSSE